MGRVTPHPTPQIGSPPPTRTTAREALAALRAQGTRFVIAHRLSTIRVTNIILDKHDGDIVETGKHAALACEGAVASLRNAQFTGESAKIEYSPPSA